MMLKYMPHTMGGHAINVLVLVNKVPLKEGATLMRGTAECFEEKKNKARRKAIECVKRILALKAYIVREEG